MNLNPGTGNTVVNNGTIVNTNTDGVWHGAIWTSKTTSYLSSGITNNGLLAIGNDSGGGNQWQAAVKFASNTTFVGDIVNTGTIWGGAGTFGSTTITGSNDLNTTNTKIISLLPSGRHTGITGGGQCLRAI